eukprot:CAMPEP_0178928750 /NCGR_PEP_ID=MMETSP0786-20121207/20115_1 /TAXON_ID=186022 /ORGANISM="Thalassionema frauenfeldii, Strain CCMP 1798" /LENGTH=182 /DNA_ID=CAMNT_0020604725 /DNA_START=197 /DNA_END=745 /DNA_ORIENTATION=+
MSQESQSESIEDEPQFASDDDFSYDQVGDALEDELNHNGKKPISNSLNYQRKVATAATPLSASEAPFDEPTVTDDQKLNEIIDDIETDIANAIEVIEKGSFDEEVDSGPEIIIEGPSSTTLLPSYPLSARRSANRSNLSTKRSSSLSEKDQQDDLSHFLRERRKEARRSRESRKQPPINMEI